MRPIKRRGEFRIESNRTLRNPHWWPGGNELLVHDRSLAVSMAAKTRTEQCGGEVIFRKCNDCGCARHS